MTTPALPGNGQSHPPRDDAEVISLIAIASGALRNRYVLVLLPLTFAVAALALSLLSPRQYEAQAAFVPQGAQQGRSPMMGVATQLGIQLPTSAPGLNPPFYARLMTTRDLLLTVVATEFEFPVEGETRRGTLVDLYELGGEAVEDEGEARELAVQALQGSINTRVDYETGIVSLRVSSTYPRLSELIAARVLELTQEFDLNKRQNQAAAERRFAEERLNEKRAELEAAEEALKVFMERNRLFATSPELLLEHGRLQRDVASRQQVFTVISQMYEQARIDEVRNTPMITIVSVPEGTARPQSRGTVLRVFIAGLLGLMLATVIAVVREYLRRSRHAEAQRYTEFAALGRETLQPFRVFRSRARTPGR